MVRRIKALFHSPGDVVLWAAIGLFIVRLPRRIEQSRSVPELLEELRRERFPRASQERIVRLRGWWLWKFFGACNTCYVRALTLYRFLDARDSDVGLHFGIERRDNSRERLHGHAWVTQHGEIIEGPDEALQGRVREVVLRR